MKRKTITMRKSGVGRGRIEHICIGIAAVALGFLLFGCASAKISGQREAGTAPTAKSTVIYVTDFELDAQNIQPEPGLLLPPPPGPLGNILPKPPGAPKDPAVRARELVDLMSTSLVENLTQADLNARRLRAGEPPPAEGWLVRGVFTQVAAGHRLPPPRRHRLWRGTDRAAARCLH